MSDHKINNRRFEHNKRLLLGAPTLRFGAPQIRALGRGAVVADPDEYIKVQLDDSLKERIKLHLDLMDKHALNIIRTAARIEIILSEAVKSKFVNEIGVQKVVGDSLARLIQLSFALGVIKQKTYESLLNFKGIRNRMAHDPEPDMKIKDLLSMLLFLGNNAEGIVQKRGSYLAEWHKVSLELLVEHVEHVEQEANA